MASSRPLAKGSATAVGLLTAALVQMALVGAQAQVTATLTVIHNFSSSEANARSSLVQGSDGNFYGTTYVGGANGIGTVFQITPAGALTTLHSFAQGDDGANPASALVPGSDGNLYGTTYVGGVNRFGVIFKITPSGALTPLYSFKGSDGANLDHPLVQGSDGNFYGATGGGAGNSGTVFRLTPAGTLSTLHSFSGSDGKAPYGLVQGSDGNFYGTTTFGGGDSDDGTVFKVTPAGVFTNLHSFSGSDGAMPEAGLVQGEDGSLYGTTSRGGPNNDGTVFRITPEGVLTTLYSFGGGDGVVPGALVRGHDGNFYGLTPTGGPNNDDGTAFQVTPSGAFTTLHNFKTKDGATLSSNALALGNDGNFYGTAGSGGTAGYGTFFKLTIPTFFTGQTALGNGVYYLAFSNRNPFGYYSYLTDPLYIFHVDLGYEYAFYANNSSDEVYFYDFASDDFFYTSPTFPFPYLYDFNLQTVLYYYPDTTRPGHYTTNPRYFFDFATGRIISK